MKVKFKKLKRDFYTRPTLIVAKDLLGKYIVRKIAKRSWPLKSLKQRPILGPKTRPLTPIKTKEFQETKPNI
jgi:hypothetical protein